LFLLAKSFPVDEEPLLKGVQLGQKPLFVREAPERAGKEKEERRKKTT
jgi:hypothetical protein